MAQRGVRQTTLPSGVTGGSSAIPDKLYFRIGEVAQLCGVPTYVLRFWESEFPNLKPNKGGTGQRLYRRRDVEMALRIKTLLYDEGFTIPGARQMLKTEQKHKEPQLSLAIVESESSTEPDRKALRRLRTELQDLLKILSAALPEEASAHPIRLQRPMRPTLRTTENSDDLFR